MSFISDLSRQSKSFKVESKEQLLSPDFSNKKESLQNNQSINSDNKSEEELQQDKCFNYKLLVKDLLSMGFQLEMIEKCFLYYKINNIMQAVTLITKENDVWQHKFYHKPNELICDICNENSDHLDYKTQNYLERISNESNRLSQIVKEKIMRYSLGPLKTHNFLNFHNFDNHSQHVFEAESELNLNKIKSESYTDTNKKRILYSSMKEPKPSDSIDDPFSKQIIEEDLDYTPNPDESEEKHFHSEFKKTLSEDIRLKENTDPHKCNICYTEHLKLDQLFSLSCKHTFCIYCWQDYLENKINNGDVEEITCMQSGCGQLLNEEDLFIFINTELQEKYNKFKLNKMVIKSENMKFCPYPNCGGYAHREPINDTSEIVKTNQYVICNINKHKFCFICQKMYHGSEKCENVI